MTTNDACQSLMSAKLAFVIAAAGRGCRVGVDKMSERLGDRTVLEMTVDAVRAAVPSVPVVAVVGPDWVEGWRTVLESDSPRTTVIVGGPRRQESVRLGVERAAELGAEIVAIHDGARPLVHSHDIRRVIDAIGDASAAILCAEIFDTVKRIDNDGIVQETLDRGSLWLAQTPQVFRVAALETAWRRQDLRHEWSDEAALIEADGGRVRCVVAEHPNPKITTPTDLELVRALIGRH